MTPAKPPGSPATLDPRLERTARYVVQACTLAVGGGALAVAVGWCFGQWSFATLGADYVPMAPTTAWSLVLLAAALFLHRGWPQNRKGRGFGAAVAGVTCALALLVLARVWFPGLPDLETRLADTTATVGGVPVGRMSPHTAATLLCAAGALSCLLCAPNRMRLRRGPALALALAVCGSGLVTLLAYAAGAPLLYGSGRVPMALLTAIALSLLGAGLMVAAHPDNWLLQALTGAPPGPADAASRRFRWALVATFVLLVTGITATGLYYLRRELADARLTGRQELSAIAEMKVRELARWRRGRLGEASFFSRAAFVGRDVSAFLANPSSRSAKDDLVRWMTLLLASDHYARLALFDPRGHWLLSVPEENDGFGPEIQEEIATALRAGGLMVTDLHRDEGAGAIHLNIAFPIHAPADPAPIAVMLLRIDASRYLFPLLQSWPTPSRTAETLLVRRDGDDVLFLNELRHRSETALSLREPINDPHLPAARAVRGETGVREGVDYRGVPVLADVRPVPESPWFVVAKVDQEEIYAPARERGWTIIAILFVLALAVALSLNLIWRRRDAELLLRQVATEHERAMLAERVAHLLKSANDSIFLVDEQWRILEANDRAVETYGWPLAELKQKTALDVRAPECRADFPSMAERLRAEGHSVLETVHQRRDGSTFPVEISNRRVQVGGVTQTLAIVRNITERKRAEADLRASEARYRSLFDNMLNGFAYCRMLFDGDRPQDFTYLAVNHAFETLTGLKDVVGRQVSEVIPGIREADPGLFEIYGRVARTGAAERFETYVAALKMWFAISVYSPGRDHFVAVFDVITERKRAEAALRENEARLRQSEKLAAIGQLAGGIAHDFNNQLTGILGFADLLAARLEEGPLRRYAENIVVSARRAADLTQKMLAFGRKGKYLSVPVDLHGLVGEVVDILGHSLDKRIRINQRLRAGGPVTLGDPSQLQNALLNLALNARDAMPGGGELTFETDVTTLDAEYCRESPCELTPGPYLRVGVTDTGCGMTDEVKRHLFEPFFTTKAVGEGTGMGLASVYGTMRNHHGAVSVDSEVGRGTTVHLYLPRAPGATGSAESTPVAAPVAAAAPARGTARILLVDDEAMVRAAASALLRELGYSVATCADGREAVAYYRANWREVDLVILDLVMPEMGGREAFQAMRAFNPRLRALISSGHDQNDAAQTVVVEGGLGYLGKPYHMAEVAQAVAVALARNELRGER